MALTGKAHTYRSLNEAEPLKPEDHVLDFTKVSNNVDAIFTFVNLVEGKGAK